MKNFFRWFKRGVCLILLIILIGNLWIYFSAKPFIKTSDEVEPTPVGIVFGAGLNFDGTPGAPLRDRLNQAISLYQQGKISKILLTGDNRFVTYNEPGAMQQYALDKGIPEEDLILDFAGRRTYDSCYRARAIFGLDQSILFTQRYHLYRALFLCNQLGVQSQGVAVEQSPYLLDRYLFWQFREILARMSALWDIYVLKPLPVLGDPEPIFE